MEKKKFNMENFNELSESLGKGFEFWNVDDFGNILWIHQNYPIPADLLTKTNWLNHILRKNDRAETLIEFYFAYIKALKNAGYKSITIDLIEPDYISGEK